MRWLLLLILAGCGSGGVSGPPPAPGPLNVSPAPATLYAGQPFTFQVTGGSPPYRATSSDQSILAVSGVFGGEGLTVLPDHGGTLTLSVDDAVAGNGVNVPVTVKARTVSSTISLTPTSTQGGCLPAVCSGSDAEVAASLALDGTPLPGRAVRFEVVTGAFGFVNGNNVTGSVTVLSDSTGKARALLRVQPSAQNQSALLRVTDLESGYFTETGFTIAQATGGSPGFFASPDSVTFSGANQGQCATNTISANVYVYGGTPPYTVSNPGSAFQIDPSVISAGESFRIIPTGVCVAAPGFTVTIADAAGRTTTTKASNVPGTAVVPPLVVSPATVTLNDCGDIATISAAGGDGHYVARAGHNSIVAKANGPSITVRLARGAHPITPVDVTITSGAELKSVAVTLTANALSTDCQ